jgi:hypothetical protein
LTTLCLWSCSTALTYKNDEGCVTYWDKADFPIVVSPDASLGGDYLLGIEEAVNSWNTEVGTEVFIVLPHVLQYTAETHPGVLFTDGYLPEPWIGLCPTEQTLTEEGANGRIWRAYCILHTEKIPNYEAYVRTVEHELGHSLGLKHSPNLFSIMYYSLSDNSTEFDKAHVKAIRSMMRGSYKNTVFSGLLDGCF